MQNFIQFNGMYGCNFCEQLGKYVRTENGGNVRAFPYDINLPKGPLRMQEQCIDAVKVAIQQHTLLCYEGDMFLLV